MTKRSQWVSTSAAAAAVGVSPQFLLRNRSKLFRAGKHYRNKNPKAYRPTYQWHVKNIEQLLSTEE